MNETFSTMHYNQRFLVIRNTPDKNPVAICECYLPEVAETICTALTELQNKSEQDDETKKSEGF